MKDMKRNAEGVYPTFKDIIINAKALSTRVHRYYSSLHPNHQFFLIISTSCLMAAPWLFFKVLLLTACFGFGYLYSDANLRDDRIVFDRLKTLKLREEFLEKDPIKSAKNYLENYDVDDSIIPMDIKSTMDDLVGLIVKDFINNWFSLINYSKDDAFPSSLRMLIRYSFVQLGLIFNGIQITTVSMRIFERFIIHMREYRNFESLSLPLETYYEQYPDDLFSRLSNEKQVIALLKEVSKKFVAKLVPKIEAKVPVGTSFLEEILATNILLSIVELVSDPDYINQYIVQYYNDLVAEDEISNGAAASSIPEPTFTIEKPLFNGGKDTPRQFYVKVVEGRRIPIKGLSSSIFCRVMCGKLRKKTKKVNVDVNPIWNEKFNFEWRDNSAKALDGIVIDIFDSNFITELLLGSVYIQKNALTPNKFEKRCSSEVLSKDEQAGQYAELSLEVMFIETLMDDEEDGQSEDEECEKLGTLTPNWLKTISKTGMGIFGGSGTNSPSRERNPSNVSAKSVVLNNLDATEVMHSILEDNETLSEFAQYLTELDLYQFFNFYVTVDSFSGQTISGLNDFKADLETIQSSFFAISIVSSLFSNTQPETLNRFDQILKRLNDQNEIPIDFSEAVWGDKEGRDIFLDLKNSLIEIFRVNFWKGFTKSQYFVTSFEKVTSPKKDLKLKPSYDSLKFSTTEEPPSHILTEKRPPSPTRSSKESERDISNETHSHKLDENLTEITVGCPIVDSESVLSNHWEVPNETNNIDPSLLTVTNDNNEKTSISSNSITDVMTTVPDMESKFSISGIKVTIMDITDDSPQSISSKPTRSSLMFNIPKSIVTPLSFLISVEKLNGSGGWIKTQPFNEFQRINTELKFLYPKMAKIPFPSRPKIPIASTAADIQNTELKNKQQKIRDTLGLDLERWLNAVLSDEMVCTIEILNRFMKPSNEMKADKPLITDGENMGSKFSGAIVGVFKTAGKGVAGIGVGIANGIVGGLGLDSPARNSQEFSSRLDVQDRRTSNISNPEISNVTKRVSIDGNLEFPSRESSLFVTSSIPYDKPSMDGDSSDKEPIDETQLPSDIISQKPILEEDSKVGSIEVWKTKLAEDKAKLTEEKLSQPFITPERSESLKKETATQQKLTKEELEIILECVFGAIEEAFNLSNPDQWIRQKGLHMVKTILRTAYGPTISNMVKSKLVNLKNSDSIAGYIKGTRDSFWDVDGNWRTDVTPLRSENEKEDDKILAKQYFVEGKLFSVNAIAQIAGRGNTTNGLIRLFNCFQHKELNRHLVCMVIKSLTEETLGRR